MQTTVPDLSIQIEDTKLNIRVVVLLLTPNGYIFEIHEDGYLFPLGGRVKLNETTIEAAKREVKEEINLDLVDFKIAGIIENFFKPNEKIKYHELNVVYRSQITDDIDIAELKSEGTNKGYKYITADNLDSDDIKPKVITEFLNSEEAFKHIVNKEY